MSSDHTPLSLPALSLVLLIGASGSGKSTFARKHFGQFETISSDFCRGLVSNDETDQSATRAAFEVLNVIASTRLKAGLLTVVDATNVQKSARAELIKLARDHDVLPVAIVFDLPEHICQNRNKTREDRHVPSGAIHRQCEQLRQSMKSLAKEGLRAVHVVKSEEEVERAEIVRTRLYNDRRDDHGPFDIIGDVHGCLDELLALLEELGYAISFDDQDRAVDATHPQGRRAIFLGDMVDRGPNVPGVLRLVMGMVEAGHALAVTGNHEAKMVRALSKRGEVTLTHGLAETLEALRAEPEGFSESVRAWCDGLVAHYVLDEGALVVAHAGLKEEYHGRASGRVRAFALYGDVSGEKDEYGLPVRYPWASDYRGRAMVVYGHTPVVAPQWVNNTICIDTGCAFGGSLTALRYPEKELVSVPAAMMYCEPARPLGSGSTLPSDGVEQSVAGSSAQSGNTGESAKGRAVGETGRDRTSLDIADVLGRRVIETTHMGKVTIQPEQAAGALEVMSRFAVAPQLLAYLPPTMSPVASAREPDYLEHPTEAFEYFASQGVDEVICERKHMGSRAVIWVFRNRDLGEKTLGLWRQGVIHTRTGREFFDHVEEAAALERISDDIGAAGLWSEWGADWALLDAEILPWSVKAHDLIRQQYLSVSASARSMSAQAIPELREAVDRGQDVADLLENSRRALEDTEAFSHVIEGFSWPTNGLRGVRIAPFQVLATSGRARYGQDHRWHMAMAERLARVDEQYSGRHASVVTVPPDPLLIETEWIAVSVKDETSRQAAVEWWKTLTESGGEGMVVKPMAMPVRGVNGLVQPGLKVRGREYLRITYGPHYMLPWPSSSSQPQASSRLASSSACEPQRVTNLELLKKRSVDRKRSLALREYALGLEAIDRLVAGEPLWRVHEAVFGVLALESEPVDPRL